MKGFSEQEVAKLTQMAKEGIKQGKNLTEVFSGFAKISGRASGSVRNFYYALLKTEQGKTSGLTAGSIVLFTKCETVKLVTEVLVGSANGKSIRKVIAEMSKGDEKLALRIQNKYRNVIAKERDLVEEVKNGLLQKGIPFKDPYAEKKLKKGFAYHRLESEINKLFEKIALKEKQINADLTERIKRLESENEKLKETVIFNYYVKKKKKQEKRG